MAFADIGDVRLFYTDEGSGNPALLFVHGYTCDSHDWSWQLPYFAARHRVIAVDLRGHGRSSAPAHGYALADFASDLAELIEKLAAGPVVALGHSMGGAVVTTLAVEHPQQVAALVCVDPGYLYPDETAAHADQVVAAMAATDDPAPIVQQMFAGFDAPGWKPAMRTWQLRRAAGMPPHVLRLALMESVGFSRISNSRAYVARRACPVLSFHADPARVGIETPLFKDARSRSIGWEGAGHWLHQERPDEFNALVSAWIGRL